MKKFFAILMTLALMLSLAVPSMADDATTYSITINNSVEGHTYEAYQLFTGDLSSNATNDADVGTNAVLANIQWGANIDTAEFIKALTDAGITGLSADASAATVAEALVGEDAAKIAECAAASLKDNAAGSDDFDDNKYEISGLNPGYYLVKDKNDTLDNDHDAYTRYIIEVVEDSTVTPKSAFPTVDKQVHDETGDAETGNTDGWGETADHEINESFQFKLIATLPADVDFAAYKEYKVIFNDTMSAGITFESIASVKVNDRDVATADYVCTATAGMEDRNWTLTIDNIKKYDTNLADGATITVIYNAHLNEDAKIGNDDDNNNTVSLQYSNNPNAEGDGDLGETAPDTVWVFTYEVDSTKYKDEIKDGNELDGAGFTLYYSANGTTKDDAVKLIFDNDAKVYRPAPADATEGVVTEMTSANGGKFKVVGLDVGKYIMEETKVPAGYNKCNDIAIEITATHNENDTSAETNIKMKVDKSEASTNNVVNKAGSVLPETGGMGTTIFYVVGGIMVVAAVVLLVTKKRMSAEG